MLRDTTSYLPDDILVKVDRAAMATSLETRVPMLDPDVFRFAWSLPLDYKARSGRGKIILRELLSRYVPKHLFERPKQGFAIPLGNWLTGPLRSGVRLCSIAKSSRTLASSTPTWSARAGSSTNLAPETGKIDCGTC
jgi:asparagine synthetase B (glutamine-hydrolysing)